MTIEELKKVLQENEKVLVKFSATWCGPCRAMKPVLEEIEKENPSLKVLEIDVDDCDEGITQEYRVRSVPTLIYHENSEIRGKLVGGVSKNEILKLCRLNENDD